MLNRTMKVEKVKVEGVGDRRDEDNFKGDFDVEAQICIRDPPKSYPSRKDLNCSNQEDHLESSEVLKIGEVREENERLKEFLARSMTESQPTEMHYFEIDKKEEVKEPVEPAVYSDAEESELVSLRLGTSESRLRKEEKAKKIYSKLEEGLSLGLQGRIVEGPTSRQGKPLLDLDADNSFEEPKDEKTGDQPWPPRNKTQTHAAPKEDDQVSPQPTVKRARVSVRARCDAPTMSDGCQWRKYGQKIAKGNPCPRAYYRCTVAPGCPVRKQVQRCAEDMSILITTYEGTHNHALPISATAMASTTSAAASMLMSGSSISQPAAMGYSTSFSTSSVLANIHGANISMSNNSIYSSNSHPTITLDLTSPSSAPQVKFSPNLSLTSRYSSSFNLSTSESNKIPTSWSNGYLSYGAQPHTKSDIISSMAPPPSLGIWQPQDNFNLSFLPNKMINSAPSLPSQQHSLTHMIAGAITSHPRFQSAVAAALTSYVGGAQAGREGSSYNLQQQEQLASPPTHAAVATRNDCTPRYLTISNSPNLNQRQ